MPGLSRWSGLICALALYLIAGCGGGGNWTNVQADHDTPTTLKSSDKRVVAVIPVGTIDTELIFNLTNRSSADRKVQGPEGRTLEMAMELTAVFPPGYNTGGDTAGDNQAAQAEGEEPETTTEEPVPELTGSVDITLIVPGPLPLEATIPVYKYNSSSKRYEDAGMTGNLNEDGTELSFTITDFGRYAYYSLLPGEYPPPTPAGLELTAASTEVRKLGWARSSDSLVTGYNLYRTAAGTDSWAKVNTDALPKDVTQYVDELSDPGAYEYRLVSVNGAGLESSPTAVVQSPAVEFDLLMTFGEDRLREPGAMAVDAGRGRLYICDPAIPCIWVYSWDGEYITQITSFGQTNALDPAGIAVAADGGLYASDAGRNRVYILDRNYARTDVFGAEGTGPGEFTEPGQITVIGDRVLVGDPQAGTIQSFTPRGVYLDTIATLGTDDGFFTAPGGMHVALDGKVFITDTGNDRIQMFSEVLEFDSIIQPDPLEPLNDGGLTAPLAVTEDFRGYVYITDTGNRRVYVLDGDDLLFHFGAEGGLIVEFGQGGPVGTALDRTTGYLYVTDPGNNRVAVFTS